MGAILSKLFKQKGVELVEGHAMPDHVHVCVSIPPKHSVSSVLGLVKGKSAIQIYRKFLKRNQNFTAFHFWSRGADGAISAPFRGQGRLPVVGQGP